MLTVIPCPDCGVPAEVTERFSLPSTEGPVGHVALSCAAGHHFRMAVDRLSAPTQQQLTVHRLVLSPEEEFALTRGQHGDPGTEGYGTTRVADIPADEAVAEEAPAPGQASS